ncbi:MAG: hypothetical protein J6A16_11130 [Oscillospiraceae bacterium]|nr:hypothetical protein [Oscillospiraceae bacterium]
MEVLCDTVVSATDDADVTAVVEVLSTADVSDVATDEEVLLSVASTDVVCCTSDAIGTCAPLSVQADDSSIAPEISTAIILFDIFKETHPFCYI